MEEELLPKRKPSFSKSYEEQESAELRELGHRICSDYLHGPWAQVPVSEFEITPLGGGLTNKLYVCNLPKKYQCENNVDHQQVPTQVLWRVYGMILQDFKAQIQESVVYSILAERGVGPKLYAVFPGGRLEEFLPSRTLTTPDLRLPDMSRNIARRTAEYHYMKMPLKKEPSFIVDKLRGYLDQTLKTSFKDLKLQKLYRKVMSYNVSGKVEEISRLCFNTNEVVVFCHNDIQEGNILFTGDHSNGGNPVQLIDFEYSAYSYRGFDFGNHFVEWMYNYSYSSWPHFTYIPEHFPTRQEQVNYLTAYLDEMYKLDPSKRKDAKWQLDYLLHEANRFCLLSHIFWALWSVVQAKISDISFGYLEYALARLEAYDLHKKQLENGSH